MEILTEYSCDAHYDVTGATTTAWVFLGVFVALIIGDGLLTSVALRRALAPDSKKVLCC